MTTWAQLLADYDFESVFNSGTFSISDTVESSLFPSLYIEFIDSVKSLLALMITMLPSIIALCLFFAFWGLFFHFLYSRITRLK